MRTALFSLIIPVLLIGCTKDQEIEVLQEHNGLHTVVFHASWDPETRTALQEDGSVFWSPGDSICIFAVRKEGDSYISSRYKFISTNTTEASRADFAGNVDGLFEKAIAYYAIYPYNETNSAGLISSGPRISTTIPPVQTAVSGGYDPSAFVSVAIADNVNDRLFFRNLCGGVKFSVSQNGIKEVTFKHSLGGRMSGRLEAYLSDTENIDFRGAEEDVTVRAPGESYFEVGKFYYAVMCPFETDNPLIVTYKKDSTQADYFTEGATSIKRSVFKRLYNKDENLTFKKLPPVKDGAVIMYMNADWDERKSITEVYFHPSSNYVTDKNFGTADRPVYFEKSGTVTHYYTPLESFNVKNVSHQMFASYSHLIKVDLSGIDTSEATDFSGFFAGCTSLISLDLSNFDTSNAINMMGMFSGCSNLESLDLSSFNTSRVVDMSYMFVGCKHLVELDLGNFDTSHVINMCGMFQMCRNLRELNLSSFDTRCCKDMSWMFNYCVSLEKLDLTFFDVSAVSNALYMCHNISIHRKHCIIRASEATKKLMCGESGMNTDMPNVARNYFIMWLAPGEDFPVIEDPFADLYKSVDYSKDMSFSCIQSASKGKGIDLVIMGDAYSDRLINDGTYDRDLTNAVEQIFMEPPLKSLRDYFNIYISYVVSENETFTGITALDLIFDDWTTHISGGDGIVDDYISAALPDYGREWMTVRPTPFIILLANVHRHAGTCAWFSSGSSLVYTTLGIDDVDFHATQCHEFGHALGLLDDEYDESGWTFEDTEPFISKSSEGWWPNVDITNDPNRVKWSRFLQDERYADQGLGLFEGGSAYYAHGIWRPTENSLMNDAPTGFNAPSREALYKRVHELAEDSFVYDYETFVAFDQNARAEASTRDRAIRRIPERNLPHLPPPVFIQGADNPYGACTTLHR